MGQLCIKSHASLEMHASRLAGTKTLTSPVSISNKELAVKSLAHSAVGSQWHADRLAIVPLQHLLARRLQLG